MSLRRPGRLTACLAAGVAGLAVVPAVAQAGATSYTRCDDAPGTTYVGTARVGCSAVGEVAAAVGAAQTPAGELSALEAAGWTPMRALPVGRTGSSHDLIAVRGRGALRIRRVGTSPSLDGWSAGRELVLSRSTIVGGRPIPRDAAFCTSAFLVRQKSGALAGLSAAHCGGLRSDGRVQRRNVALRRPPQPGVVLGRVLQILTRRLPLDALLVPASRATSRTATAVVDRGIRKPPLPVVGSARTLSGRRVCFTGRTSGADQCGRIRGSVARPLESLFALQGLVVRCTTIRAREGDSGGPVYTAPGSDGAVRAVGIVTLISGPQALMCFTPVRPVLDALDARLVVASPSS
ncbi:hypothetical protein DSM112329_03814 [Paraconexibacter sp. AEG42_29]|uniref:Peptidase S1 domain-containing protein n=1 Tax=Paraconexibacter sp. AEG42_29 TaxID=2997339 RepID=A0AAU7AZ90_9ACTN